MKLSINILLLGLALLSPHFALANETGTALKADTLRTEPFADARTAGNLNKDESVQILEKKGAWLHIKTPRNSGWVRLLSIRRTNANNNAVRGAVEVASGRAGTGKVVSSTGIRGLSAEELKTAQFNEAEMKKLESYASSASEANKFASAAGLTANAIPYIKGAQ